MDPDVGQAHSLFGLSLKDVGGCVGDGLLSSAEEVVIGEVLFAFGLQIIDT